MRETNIPSCYVRVLEKLELLSSVLHWIPLHQRFFVATRVHRYK